MSVKSFLETIRNNLLSPLKKLFPLSPQKMTTAQFGRWAETLAGNYLKKNGMKILAKNYRTKSGELDLIARDKETIVFIEVKAARDVDAEPELKVNQSKRRKIIQAAKNYIASRNLYDSPSRFDIVTVQYNEKGEPQIQHEENAFDA